MRPSLKLHGKHGASSGDCVEPCRPAREAIVADGLPSYVAVVEHHCGTGGGGMVEWWNGGRVERL